MITISDDSIDDRLRLWRQGDYALDTGGFLFADVAESSEKFDAKLATDDVVGSVVVSQTCDIVRLTDDRLYVAVCPLVTRETKFLKPIKSGRYPSLTMIEHAPLENSVVDLARVMSVSKRLLSSWTRIQGFSTSERAIRFAGAIERKFGRFAFPDAFNEATKQFQDRVRSRHDKLSKTGDVYRSIHQFRFVANPHWEADFVRVSMIVILLPTDRMSAKEEAIRAELQSLCDAVKWGPNFGWATPEFYCASAADLRGSDILGSQLADFEYLSG